MSSRVSRDRHPRFTLDDDEAVSESEGPPAIVINDEGAAVARQQAEKVEKERGEERRDATEGKDGAPPGLGRAKGAAAGFEEKATSNGHSAQSSNLPATTEKKNSSYPPEPSPQPSLSRSRSHDAPAAPPAKQEIPSPSFLHKLLPPLLSSKLNWKGIRPVLRASVAAWCGLILILHPTSEAVLGQASFLCLIGEFVLGRGRLSAQADPFPRRCSQHHQPGSPPHRQRTRDKLFPVHSRSGTSLRCR